ncbi:MAG: hypothetical protein CPDRYMAC_3868 [uncultured Paraburkholderia sp.]|nr:MAG: hypothetical protein CPDRYDRY_3731 [uncultured Paraburkholderia sp.]CAH2933328.1 MAG: hypothetical protein CPDRYMAC_3868 [uncultured Paraburkholderia sp.]
MIGVLARCQSVYQRVSSHRLGWIVSALGALFAVAHASEPLKRFANRLYSMSLRTWP